MPQSIEVFGLHETLSRVTVNCPTTALLWKTQLLTAKATTIEAKATKAIMPMPMILLTPAVDLFVFLHLLFGRVSHGDSSK